MSLSLSMFPQLSNIFSHYKKLKLNPSLLVIRFPRLQKMTRRPFRRCKSHSISCLIGRKQFQYFITNGIIFALLTTMLNPLNRT